MNSVVLSGRVTRDGEVRFFSSGNQVTDFSVAVNRRFKKGDEWVEETSFIDCRYWGKKVVNKGDVVAVNGELRQDTWEKDGQKRSKLLVNVNTIEAFNGYKKSEYAQSVVQDEVEGDGEDVPF